MDLSPTSKLGFLSCSGEPLNSPSEWQQAFIEVYIPQAQWEEVRLWLQGKELELSLKRLNTKTRVVTEWPRSNPGYYRLRLEYQNEVEEKFIVVWPQKISREAFAKMLEDLDARLPTSVALGLRRNGSLAGLKLLQLSESTLAQEMVRLRRAINGTANRPGLTEILPKLASNPHQIFKTNEIWIRQEQVHRPSPGGLVEALCRGHNLDVNGQPIRVLDRRVEHTTDVYENQLVKLFFELVNQRLRRVRYICDANPKYNLFDEVQSLSKQLKKARQQAAFLDKVSQPKHLPNQITMVLLKHPPYHAILAGYLEFIRSPTVRLEDSDIDAPLENLPHLYQVWGTLWIIQTLLEVGLNKGYQVEKHSLVSKDKNGIYALVLPNGQPALILIHPQHKTKVKLIPERTYGKDGELHSATDFKQRPDVAIEIQLPDGLEQVYLFDSKYKRDSELLNNGRNERKPQKEDIDKMHAYRNDIRNREGERAVRYAAILYPGSFISYAKAKIDALPAYPGAEAELQNHLRRVLDKALDVS
jgi:predicted component of viral defense system (DUF524 family)